jgi:hypothetical protein
VDSLKKLAETYEKFAKFERLAYRMDSTELPDDPGSEALTPERLNEGARRIAFMLHRAAQDNRSAP